MNKKTKRRAFTGFGVALLMILGFVIFFYKNFKTVVVSGPSMQPTFHSGTRLLISNAYWLVGAIEPKDIVVIKGDTEKEYIIKRVYRMGGQVVDFTHVPKSWSLQKGEYVVPQGNIYVLGDNRLVSEDSRYFGPVPLDRVLGKVVIRP